MLLSRIKKGDRKKVVIISAIILILGIFLLLRMNEDTWTCKDGQWIRHGNPSSNIPTSECK